MKERPGMGGATGEIGQRQDPEHGRFQRLPERHVRRYDAGWRMCWRRGVPPAAGAGRSSSAAGRITAQAMKPSVNMAKRQSWATISQRASGATSVVPSARPAETRETARLRWRTNQLAAAAVNGTYIAPAASPAAVP